jgi:hypothetical protein
MREYAKISSSFWTGKTGRAIRGDSDAQIVALYLLTSLHANMIGVFYCPITYISHETGSPFEGAFKGLQRLIEVGFCTYDEESETVWVHEMARFQIGDALKASDNRVKDIRKRFDEIPASQIQQGFYEKYKEAFHLIEPTFPPVNNKPLESPSEAPPKPVAVTVAVVNQNQSNLSDDKLLVASVPLTTQVESEKTETEKISTTPTLEGDFPSGLSERSVEKIEAPPCPPPGFPTCPQQEIIALYAEVLPDLTQPRTWEGARQTNLTARWRWVLSDLKRREKPHDRNAGLDFFRRLFCHVGKSDFLMGRTKNAWDGCGLDWIVKAENFLKVIEGRYDNRVAA